MGKIHLAYREFPQSLYCACPTDYVISNQLACATELIYLFDRDNETQFYQRGKIMGPNLRFCPRINLFFCVK